MQKSWLTSHRAQGLKISIERQQTRASSGIGRRQTHANAEAGKHRHQKGCLDRRLDRTVNPPRLFASLQQFGKTTAPKFKHLLHRRRHRFIHPTHLGRHQHQPRQGIVRRHRGQPRPAKRLQAIQRNQVRHRIHPSHTHPIRHQLTHPRQTQGPLVRKMMKQGPLGQPCTLHNPTQTRRGITTPHKLPTRDLKNPRSCHIRLPFAFFHANCIPTGWNNCKGIVLSVDKILFSSCWTAATPSSHLPARPLPARRCCAMSANSRSQKADWSQRWSQPSGLCSGRAHP
jgi:hypothetical protein